MAGERWAVGYSYEIICLSSLALTYIQDITWTWVKSRISLFLEFHTLEVFHMQGIFRQNWVSWGFFLVIISYINYAHFLQKCIILLLWYLFLDPFNVICSATMPVSSCPILISLFQTSFLSSTSLSVNISLAPLINSSGLHWPSLLIEESVV